MKKLLPFLLLAVPWTLVASSARANAVPEMPLEKRIGASDIVVLGTVIRLDDVETTGIATVRVSRALKGAPPETIRFVYRSGIAELDPRCCVIGDTYLLMLRQGRDAVYESTNGPHGVIDVGTQDRPSASPSRAVTWPGAR